MEPLPAAGAPNGMLGEKPLLLPLPACGVPNGMVGEKPVPGEDHVVVEPAEGAFPSPRRWERADAGKASKANPHSP